MPSSSLINRIVFHTLFLIIGIIGIITVRKKEAPLFAVPIRGGPAILIGLCLMIVSFGLILMGLIFDIIRCLNLR